ncbi:MAG TPA: hypothetical protein DCZ75_06265 [Geobacter sp.]|nr:hypothetical protein [Geobacter sp.]
MQGKILIPSSKGREIYGSGKLLLSREINGIDGAPMSTDFTGAKGAGTGVPLWESGIQGGVG